MRITTQYNFWGWDQIISLVREDKNHPELVALYFGMENKAKRLYFTRPDAEKIMALARDKKPGIIIKEAGEEVPRYKAGRKSKCQEPQEAADNKKCQQAHELIPLYGRPAAFDARGGLLFWQPPEKVRGESEGENTSRYFQKILDRMEKNSQYERKIWTVCPGKNGEKNHVILS